MGEKLSPDSQIAVLRAVRAEARMPPEVAQRIVDGAHARRRRRRAVWLGVPCVVAAAAALALWLGRAPRPSTPGGGPTPAQPALTPAPVAVHASGADSAAVALGAHRAELAPHTRLQVLPAAAEDVALVLTTGQAGFAVEPLAPGHGFRVATGDVLVEVVGTRFTVALEDGCTWVAVDEGRVRVTPADAAPVELDPGARRTFCTGAGAAQAVPGEGWVREALALVSAGREPARAAALLERYLATYERGVFAEDAMFHLALLYRRLDRHDDARRVARGFVERFPSSRRAAHLRKDVLPP
ncbi:FecR domain-containing protein [Haliangium sp.]|uniref:tetratricopeptide repeat protein n=1 Tax=Haliangium sp. TaxID=2663208 RepID=UPI003D0FD4FD